MTDSTGNPSRISKFFGIPSFAMTLSVPSGGGSQYQLRASVYMNRYLSRHSLFADGQSNYHTLEEPKDLDPQHALSFLCDNWLKIAGPFVVGGSAEAVVDLSGVFATKVKPVVMTRKGPYIGFDFDPLHTDHGAESVVIIECLLQLGDLLAAGPVSAATAQHWRNLRNATDLLPFAIETTFGHYEADEATAYFAKILDLSKDDYVRWAVYAHADHELWVYRDSDETQKPEPHDTFLDNPSQLPADLPDQETVDRLLQEAAAERGVSVAEFWEEAVDCRNIDARQSAIYRRWYQEKGRQREIAFTGTLKSSITGKMVYNRQDAFVPSGQKEPVQVRLSAGCDPRDCLRSGRSLELTGSIHFECGKPIAVDVSEVDIYVVAERMAEFLPRL